MNDTEAMSKFLHLGPFTGRPAEMRDELSGHLVNPMLQCVLSQIPMLTLCNSALSYTDATRSIVGSRNATSAALLIRDQKLFQEQGLDAVEADRELHNRLVQEYSSLASAHPAIREVADWLRSGYQITKTIVANQLD